MLLLPPPAPKVLPEKPEVSEMEKARLRHDKFMPIPPRPVREKRCSKPRFVKPGPEITNPAPHSEPEIAYYASELNAETEMFASAHHDDGERVAYMMSEVHGEFSFRDTILDQLDRYFFYLKRMKRLDPDSYGFYKHLGATIIPYVSVGESASWEGLQHWPDKDNIVPTYGGKIPELCDWFKEKRPGFGCFVLSGNPVSEEIERKFSKNQWALWLPRFIYFIKYDIPPVDLAPRKGGDVYKMTVFWDSALSKFKFGSPSEFGIFISDDGKTVSALEMRFSETITLPGGESFQRRTWGFPSDYERWAALHGVDIRCLAVEIFFMVAKRQEMAAHAKTRVSVTKHGETATFSIDPSRSAYFFKDRDVKVGDSRIFHSVRPHTRTVGNKEVEIKEHFRGLRRFTWGGHDVCITVPGIHHGKLEEFNLGCADVAAIPQEERRRKWVRHPTVGRYLQEYVMGTQRSNNRRTRYGGRK
jgi:hypothetical protein